jgi:hypothetical protein
VNDATAQTSVVPGGRIVRLGWWANAVFAVTAVPAAALGSDAVSAVAIGVALLLFLAAIVAFLYAFAVGLGRSARGDNVAVASLYFLQGSAPPRVQREFLAQFVVCFVIAAATAAWEPFGVLVPMLPIGLAGVWAARHGAFPPRPGAPSAARSRRS